MTTPDQGLAKIHARFGAHDGHRALHAKGIHCVGTFIATPEAATLTRAGHMTGEPVPARVRFSNGGGDPTVPDYVPDVRGLAVSFVLPDGKRTDILSQTIPHFPFHDQEGFFATLGISKPGLAGLVRLPAFMARYPKAALVAVEANSVIARRLSFAAHRYFPFHAVKWVDAQGGSRYVRYTWQPTVQESGISKAEAKSRGRDYLFDGLREQLERGPVHMQLEVQIANDGDDPHDPSNEWPDDRRRVVVGTLEVTAVDEQADDGIVFDPMRLTDGIEPSDDPVLRYRPDVYTLSHARRTGG
ncbi:MAG: catalase family peroxidase [Aeromicrobium sp.]